MGPLPGWGLLLCGLCGPHRLQCRKTLGENRCWGLWLQGQCWFECGTLCGGPFLLDGAYPMNAILILPERGYSGRTPAVSSASCAEYIT